MANTDRQTRPLLLIGFGGLLLLLAFSGLNALSVLHKIQASNEHIREDYFNRDRVLEELKSDIYLSGTYVRDLLMEQDPAQADIHRRELEAAHARVDRNVAAYDQVLRVEERGEFRAFKAELASYFDSLKPALEWDAAQRRALGYSFMKNSLLPRRVVVVHLADQIGAVNQRQMEMGSEQIENLFARFRRSLILWLVLSLACGVLLAAGSILRILRLERTSARRFEEAEHARGVLKDLSARLVEVQESERRSLSRELHDEVGQSLSALLIGIGNVAAIVSPTGNAEAVRQLNDLRTVAERAVSVVRDMSLLLRPSMLDDLGLIPALQWQAREVSRNSDVYVQVQDNSVPDNLPEVHKTCVYRVVQESLHNVVRHANAKNVFIMLGVQAGALLLTIKDDGNGFRPSRDKGLGLLGMEERVNNLRGRFSIESQPGSGTSICVELPLP